MGHLVAPASVLGGQALGQAPAAVAQALAAVVQAPAAQALAVATAVVLVVVVVGTSSHSKLAMHTSRAQQVVTTVHSFCAVLTSLHAQFKGVCAGISVISCAGIVYD